MSKSKNTLNFLGWIKIAVADVLKDFCCYLYLIGTAQGSLSDLTVSLFGSINLAP